MFCLWAFSAVLILHYFWRSRFAVVAGILVSGLLTGGFGWRGWPKSPGVLPVRPQTVLTSWGSDPRQGCSAAVDGLALQEFEDHFDVIVICGVEVASIDEFSDTAITISSAYTIRPANIPIETPTSEAMKQFVLTKLNSVPRMPGAQVNAQIPIWYYAALVPKKVELSNVRRLSDIPRVGGKIFTNEQRKIIATIPTSSP